MAVCVQVSRMLDQNLISSFHRSKEYAAAQAQLATAAVAAAAYGDSAKVDASTAARMADEFDM
jgi:hypothetical protein